jgi:hypothetical protein
VGTQTRTRDDDPSIRKAQGRYGAALRDGNEETAAEAAQDMREATLAKRIKELADAMPPLTPERRARLAALLQPAAGGGHAA